MAGTAASRASSPDGAWIFTLYATNDGGAFVHALDAAHGFAHCLDLPWKNQSEDVSYLSIQYDKRRGQVVVLTAGSTGVVARIDARTLRVTALPRLP
jgi:hypothetical protein